MRFNLRYLTVLRGLFLAFLLLLLVLPALAYAADLSVAAPDLSQLFAQLAATYPSVAVAIVLALISLAASAVCAVTPTPAPGSAWNGPYQLLELLAVVTRTTKSTGIPLVDAMHVAQVALLDMQAKGSAASASITTSTVKSAVDSPAT